MSKMQSGFIELPASPEEMFDALYKLGLTDGLPVIPPTDDLVERFIAASGRPGSELIAPIPPDYAPGTVEKIAINAVMAGCRPEYMPVVIAAIEAMNEPEFNFLCIQATTNPAAPLVVINGPIRHVLDVNCGRSALGPGRRANATIGRALRLIMVNIGGAIPGEVDKATLGMPGKFTMCLGENEEESPWAPYHVDRGFGAGESTVTVIPVQGNANIYTPWKEADSILDALAFNVMSLADNNSQRGHGQPVMILNPGHAHLLENQGYSKERVQHELWERSKIPVAKKPKEPSAIEEGFRKIVDGHMMMTEHPEDILIVVSGGPEAYHNTYCASIGDYAVTKPVRLPG